jgi:hypothetical protein
MTFAVRGSGSFCALHGTALLCGVATVSASAGTRFPTDLKWFDLSSVRAVSDCQVCARVVPTGFGWRVKWCMTSSSLLLRMFVPLAGESG